MALSIRKAFSRQSSAPLGAQLLIAAGMIAVQIGQGMLTEAYDELAAAHAEYRALVDQLQAPAVDDEDLADKPGGLQLVDELAKQPRGRTNTVVSGLVPAEDPAG